MAKKIISSIVFVIMLASLMIIILGFSLKHAAFNEKFYKKEFVKYGVYEKLDGYDIEAINKDVLGYLRKENINIISGDFFNGREKDHLLDVRVLVNNILLAYHVSIFLFFILIFILAAMLDFDFKKLLSAIAKVILLGSLSAIFLALMLFFASSMGFEAVFQKFHETFFAQGTFLFNPDFEKIVVLYPENLFFDLLERAISLVVLSSGIAALLSAGIIWRDFFKKFSKNFRRKTV